MQRKEDRAKNKCVGAYLPKCKGQDTGLLKSDPVLQKVERDKLVTFLSVRGQGQRFIEYWSRTVELVKSHLVSMCGISLNFQHYNIENLLKYLIGFCDGIFFYPFIFRNFFQLHSCICLCNYFFQSCVFFTFFFSSFCLSFKFRCPGYLNFKFRGREKNTISFLQIQTGGSGIQGFGSDRRYKKIRIPPPPTKNNWILIQIQA